MKYLYVIQPTGRIHIGNYLGGLKLAIEKDADILIAQLHAMTTSCTADLENMREGIIRLGGRPNLQGEKPNEHFLLQTAWLIQCITPMSDLKKMTQFKDKGEGNVGFFTYPCLMAADIIIANPDYVIIGEDQLQHMEFYRKTCNRLGIKKVAQNLLTETPRIMSIKDPTKKMSKILGDDHCLYLGDNEANARKIMKAPTTPEGIKNLKQISKGLGIEYDETKNKESKEKLIQEINKIC